MQELNPIELQSVSGAAACPPAAAPVSASPTTAAKSKQHLLGGAEGVVLGAVIGAWDGMQLGALDSGSLLMPFGEVIGLGAGAAIGAAYGGLYGLDQGHDTIMQLASTFANTASTQGIKIPGGLVSL